MSRLEEVTARAEAMGTTVKSIPGGRVRIFDCETGHWDPRKFTIEELDAELDKLARNERELEEV